MVSCKKGVGLTTVYGGLSSFDRAGKLGDQHAAVGEEDHARREVEPVARTSFWNELVFATFTGTGAERVELPAASRARAVNVCAPFATVRESHANAYGEAVSSTPALTPSTRNCTPTMPTLSLAIAVTFRMSLTCALAAGEVIATLGATVSPATPATGVFMSAWISVCVNARP